MTLAEVKAPKLSLLLMRKPPVYYPESDGLPMAETDAHYRQMTDLRFALELHFQDVPDVYVAANLLVYYQEGDSSQSVAPDVFVVRGVPKGNRRIYQVWEEGKGPDVVIELTSASTRLKDLGTKKGLYELLGVQEYFLFDPLGEYLDPPLTGYRLEQGEYRRMEGEPLRSQVLGLELRVEDGQLRLYDRNTGHRLPTPAEESAARRAAESRAAYEARARHEAEAEAARLRAELARLRGAKQTE